MDEMFCIMYSRPIRTSSTNSNEPLLITGLFRHTGLWCSWPCQLILVYKVNFYVQFVEM